MVNFYLVLFFNMKLNVRKGIVFFLVQNAEVTHLFLCVPQAENDLNELKALMHSPNAIVVRAPDPAARKTF